MFTDLLIVGGLVASLMSAVAANSAAETPHPPAGLYDAWLDSPGGELHFGLEIDYPRTDEVQAWIINGSERVEVPEAHFDGGELILDFVHYNSVIRARFDATHRTLAGEWRKRQGLDAWTTMGFHARRNLHPTARHYYSSPLPNIAGRWLVRFASDDDPAVGVFTTDASGQRVKGTFLTTVGDYRFLGGEFDDTLTLSVFDGAHAFLFRAVLQEDGSLKGDFWSRDAWHDTWTAVRDSDARLPDGFGLTTWNDDIDPDDIRFRDLDGEFVSPFDDRFAGKARIIEVFGTWCPNCNDATRYLVELGERYGGRGLSILGLAFEVTGDFEEDRKQINRYIAHHGIEYPVLHCGLHDKAIASKALPLLDEVRSYPTFIFIDEAGTVRSIYTGFSGPATGDRHQKLRDDFERLIEDMLKD